MAEMYLFGALDKNLLDHFDLLQIARNCATRTVPLHDQGVAYHKRSGGWALLWYALGTLAGYCATVVVESSRRAVFPATALFSCTRILAV
jgi:hypothetical protein